MGNVIVSKKPPPAKKLISMRTGLSRFSEKRKGNYGVSVQRICVEGDDKNTVIGDNENTVMALVICHQTTFFLRSFMEMLFTV